MPYTTHDITGKRPGRMEFRTGLLYRELHSWIDIDCPVSGAWNALTDFAAWSSWNSFIPEVRGVPGKNTTVSITVRSPGIKEMHFQPRIFSMERNRRISWGGGFLGFVYQGVHEFLLEELAVDRTRFRQIEIFRGPMVLLMKDMILKTATGYQNMNEELKGYLEISRY